MIGAVLARHVRTLDLTLDEWRVMLVESGAGSGFVDMVVDGAAFVRDGLYATVTDDVERAIGRPAGSFRLWVADHREAFG